MKLPAILVRRIQQFTLIRGMGGTRLNAWRIFLTGRSGRFKPVKRRLFRDNWPAQ